jgi:hypothetical protein
VVIGESTKDWIQNCAAVGTIAVRPITEHLKRLILVVSFVGSGEDHGKIGTREIELSRRVYSQAVVGETCKIYVVAIDRLIQKCERYLERAAGCISGPKSGAAVCNEGKERLSSIFLTWSRILAET